MAAPIIGLTTYREEAAWGVWQQRADILPAQYAGAVEATGGVPLLLPPLAQEGAADAVVARIDGLVISGGADVDPARYGADPHPRTAGWRPDRDAWESALLDAAEAAGVPVLGVCRGMQVMAVNAGGRLDQHTPDLVGHERHSPGGDEFGEIEVTTVAGSRVVRAGRRAARPSTATTTSRWPTTPASWPRRTPPTARWRRWRPRATGSASPCSGTPRPPPTSACWPGWSGPLPRRTPTQRADRLHA